MRSVTLTRAAADQLAEAMKLLNPARMTSWHAQ